MYLVTSGEIFMLTHLLDTECLGHNMKQKNFSLREKMATIMVKIASYLC